MVPPRVSSPDIRANVGASGVVFQKRGKPATGSRGCICGRKNVRRVGSINQSFFVASLWANRGRKT